MATSRDNMDEEMMDIINTGTQFADGDQQDVDNQENIVQENTSEVYIFIYIFEYYIYIYLNIYHLLCVHMIFIYSFFICSPLDRRPQRRKAKIFEAQKSHWRGAT